MTITAICSVNEPTCVIRANQFNWLIELGMNVWRETARRVVPRSRRLVALDRLENNGILALRGTHRRIIIYRPRFHFEISLRTVETNRRAVSETPGKHSLYFSIGKYWAMFLSILPLSVEKSIFSAKDFFLKKKKKETRRDRDAFNDTTRQGCRSPPSRFPSRLHLFFFSFIFLFFFFFLFPTKAT